MKKRMCTVDLSNTSIAELNKSLAFYYGKNAFVSDDGQTVHHNIDLSDEVILKLAKMTKSSDKEAKVVASANLQYKKCCAWHDFNDSDLVLNSRALILSEKTLKHINYLKRIHTDMANAWFSTEHLAVPNIIENEYLHKADYFSKFPAQAMLVSTLPLDPSYVESVVSSCNTANYTETFGHYVNTQYALNPVTCYHVYSNFNDLHKKSGSMQFTLEGKAHRYEGKNREKNRLVEFNMVEIVFMETEKTVVDINKLVNFYQKFFELLQLPIDFKVSSDAFFTTDADLRSQLQERSGSKIEMIFSTGKKSLALGSINSHHDFFVKRFNLHAPYLVNTTKCTGLGVDRLMFALYSYYPESLDSILINAYKTYQQQSTCI